MPNVSTQTVLITPTSGTSTGALVDYQMASYRQNNGTVSLAVVGPDGNPISVAASSGTVNVGTINAGTINAGTVNVLGTIKDVYSALGTFTITLASLANSGSIGRVSNFIDNTTSRYQSALVSVKVTSGSAATTANTPFYVYLSRSDNASLNDDANGTVDAAGTFINTPLLGIVNCANAGTNQSYFGVFDTSPLGLLGPAWGIGVVNNSGGSLHPTAGSQLVTWTGITRISG